MFTLTQEEKEQLVANCDRFRKLKHSSSPLNAFTEHGAIMVASVLNTPQAIDVSLFVVRTFVKLRQQLLTNKDLAQKLTELEHKFDDHDGTIRALVNAIRQLMAPPPDPPRRKIGFGREQDEDRTTEKSRRK